MWRLEHHCNDNSFYLCVYVCTEMTVLSYAIYIINTHTYGLIHISAHTQRMKEKTKIYMLGTHMLGIQDMT